jgi:hypothetical protein
MIGSRPEEYELNGERDPGMQGSSGSPQYVLPPQRPLSQICRVILGTVNECLGAEART